MSRSYQFEQRIYRYPSLSRIRHLHSAFPPPPSHLLRRPFKRMRQLRLPAQAILAKDLRRDGELLAAGQ